MLYDLVKAANYLAKIGALGEDGINLGRLFDYLQVLGELERTRELIK